MSAEFPVPAQAASNVVSQSAPAPSHADAKAQVARVVDGDAQAAAAMKIQQRYTEEREKRLRADGVSQYIDLSKSEKFKHFQDDIWVDPNVPPYSALEDGSRHEFLILGAGFGGLTFAIRLIEAGMKADDIRIIDSAGGFGGTWYWNRYPGLMCDVESYIYLPFLEEMDYMPKNRYAYGHEIREYTEKIAKKYGLEDKAQFQTFIQSMVWDDNAKEWVVKMTIMRANKPESDITVRSRFVVSASGVLNQPKIPAFPGMESFKGHSFHTARWDYDYTGGSPADPSLVKLKGKKVGIIGTGATAVQAVPHLAQWAKELYVFQRTPSAVDKRDNRLTDPEWFNKEVKNKKGWQKARRQNFNAHLSNADPLPEQDLVSDGWTSMRAYCAMTGGQKVITPDAIPAHIATLHTTDFPRQQRVRERVDQIVKDQGTAEKLKAWYPGWCKRPCFHDEYLQSFNRPNVTLVDTNGKGVDRVSERGVLVGSTEYNLDVLILGTGFRPPAIGSPAFRAGITVTGRNGITIDQKWDDGVATLHGVASHSFPNFFLPGPTQSGVSANFTHTIDNTAEHVAYIIREAFMANKGYNFTVEPTAAAEEAWTLQVLQRAAFFAGLANCTPSYFNNEGERDRIENQQMEKQMKAARGAIWGTGVQEYSDIIAAWRENGKLEGLEITPV